MNGHHPSRDEAHGATRAGRPRTRTLKSLLALMLGSAMAMTLSVSPPVSSALAASGQQSRPVEHGRHGDERGTLLAWSRFVDLDFSAARIVVGRPNGGPVRELTR